MHSRRRHAPFIDELYDVAVLHDTVNFKQLSTEHISLIYQISTHPIVIPSKYFTSKKSFDTTYKAIAVFQDAIKALFRQNCILEGAFENAQQQLSQIKGQRDEAIMNAVRSYEEMKKVEVGTVTEKEKMSTKMQSEDAHLHDSTFRQKNGYSSLEEAERRVFTCSECKNVYSSRYSLQSHTEKRHRAVTERIGFAPLSNAVPLQNPTGKEDDKVVVESSFGVRNELPFSNEKKAFRGELQNVRSESKMITPSRKAISDLFSDEVKDRKKTEEKSHYTAAKQAISTSSSSTRSNPEKNTDEHTNHFLSGKHIVQQGCRPLSEVEFSGASCPSLYKSFTKHRRHMHERHFHEERNLLPHCSIENGAPLGVSGTTPRKETKREEGEAKNSPFQNGRAACPTSHALSLCTSSQALSSLSSPLAEAVALSKGSPLLPHTPITSISATSAEDALWKGPENRVEPPPRSATVDEKPLIHSPTFLSTSAAFGGTSLEAATTEGRSTSATLTVLPTTSKGVNPSVNTSVVHSLPTDGRYPFPSRHSSSEKEKNLAEVVHTPHSLPHTLLTEHTDVVIDAKGEAPTISDKRVLHAQERAAFTCDTTVPSSLYRSSIAASQPVACVVYEKEPRASPNVSTPRSSRSVARTPSAPDHTTNDAKGEMASLLRRPEALKSGDAHKTVLSTGGTSLPMDSRGVPSFHSKDGTAGHPASANSLATTSPLPFLLSSISPSFSSLARNGTQTSDGVEPIQRPHSAHMEGRPGTTSSLLTPLTAALRGHVSQEDSISRERHDIIVHQKGLQKDPMAALPLQEESCLPSSGPRKTLVDTDGGASPSLSLSFHASMAFPNAAMESTHTDPFAIASAPSPLCPSVVSTRLEGRAPHPVSHSFSPSVLSYTPSSFSHSLHHIVGDAESTTPSPPCASLPTKGTLSLPSFADEGSASVALRDALLVPHASRSPAPPTTVPSNATTRPGERRNSSSSSSSSPPSRSTSSSYTYFCSFSESDETSVEWREEKAILTESTDAPDGLPEETSLPSSYSDLFNTKDSSSNEEEKENEDTTIPSVVPASSSSWEERTQESHSLPTSKPKKKVTDIFNRLFVKSDRKKKKVKKDG